MRRRRVRLGQGEFDEGRLHADAIERGVSVVEQFAGIARGRGASEVVAIATAALREAQNREDFVRLTHERTGVEVQVVSGVLTPTGGGGMELMPLATVALLAGLALLALTPRRRPT